MYSRKDTSASSLFFVRLICFLPIKTIVHSFLKLLFIAWLKHYLGRQYNILRFLFKNTCFVSKLTLAFIKNFYFSCGCRCPNFTDNIFSVSPKTICISSYRASQLPGQSRGPLKTV